MRQEVWGSWWKWWVQTVVRIPLYESFKYVKVASLWLEVTIFSRRVCKLKKRNVSIFFSFFLPERLARSRSLLLSLSPSSARARALCSPYPLPPSFSLPLLQRSAHEIPASFFCPYLEYPSRKRDGSRTYLAVDGRFRTYPFTSVHTSPE